MGNAGKHIGIVKCGQAADGRSRNGRTNGVIMFKTVDGIDGRIDIPRANRRKS